MEQLEFEKSLKKQWVFQWPSEKGSQNGTKGNKGSGLWKLKYISLMWLELKVMSRKIILKKKK